MSETFNDEEVLGAYYRDLEPSGKLSHARGIENITHVIHRKVGGEWAAINEKVRRIFLETIGPEYLKPAALDVISRALMLGGDVYIWTVGDHGEGSHYYQRAKIEASRIVESLQYILAKNNKDRELVKRNFHTVISSENKHRKLDEILQDVDAQNIGTVFIADDKEANVVEARSVVSRFPRILCREWIIKKDNDVLGNLGAFRDSAIPEMEQLAKNGKHFALVLDWDDTLTYEIERMQEVRLKLSWEFAEHLQPVRPRVLAPAY